MLAILLLASVLFTAIRCVCFRPRGPAHLPLCPFAVESFYAEVNRAIDDPARALPARRSDGEACLGVYKAWQERDAAATAAKKAAAAAGAAAGGATAAAPVGGGAGAAAPAESR